MSDNLKEFTYSEISEHSSKKVCTDQERVGGVGRGGEGEGEGRGIQSAKIE